MFRIESDDYEQVKALQSWLKEIRRHGLTPGGVKNPEPFFVSLKNAVDESCNRLLLGEQVNLLKTQNEN